MRRSHSETRLEMLELISKGVSKPTRLMYKANLSWNPMQFHLQALQKAGLVVATQRGERKSYQITEKGLDVLRKGLEAFRILRGK